MGKLKKISVSLLFFILSLQTFTSIGNNNLTITKEIKFLIELQSTIVSNLEGTTLDFGNLIRDTKDTVIRKNYLKFNNSFETDQEVSVSFIDGEDVQDNYKKFTIDHVKKNENNNQDNEKESLDVFIKKVEKFKLKKGEVKIPIVGEIREVPKNARLGKYEKTIKVMVENKPIDPIKILKNKDGGI